MVAACPCDPNDLQEISNAVRNVYAWHGNEGQKLDLERHLNPLRRKLGLLPVSRGEIDYIILPPPTGEAPASSGNALNR